MASAAASTVPPTVGSTVWNLLERLLNICIMPTQRKLLVIVILLTCIVNTVGEYIPTPVAAQHSHIANVHHNPDFRATKKKNARMIVDSIRDSNCERVYIGDSIRASNCEKLYIGKPPTIGQFSDEKVRRLPKTTEPTLSPWYDVSIGRVLISTAASVAEETPNGQYQVRLPNLSPTS